MPTMEAPRNYRAYLLRLWRESEHDPWRATLEDPHSGEHIGFAGVDRLLAYLSQQLGEAGAAAQGPAPLAVEDGSPGR